jgi:hypothetical protein
MPNLQRHLAELGRQRVNARQNIKSAWWTISDPAERARYIELQQLFLNGTQREYKQLRRAVDPKPVVRLNAAPAPRRQRTMTRMVTKSAVRDDLHFRTAAEYWRWARSITKRLG